MTMIDCREAVRRMWAYLSEALEGTDSVELEDHLGVCQRCCGELEFSRALRERVAAAGTDQMPAQVRARVDEVLRRGTTAPESRG
jgi:mycothiol system anti-sigma-R factor